VDAENARRLDQLEGEKLVFASRDVLYNCCNGFQLDQAKKAIENLVPENLALKIGAQVICLRNFNNLGLVNGSRGVVTAFVANNPDRPELGSHPLVRYDNNLLVEHVLCEFSAIKFATADAPYIQRLQFPIRLAWALTIHKSQGQSISRAVIDIGNTFLSGQAYVALSRVPTLDGLWVKGSFGAKNIRANEDVMNFFGGRPPGLMNGRAAEAQVPQREGIAELTKEELEEKERAKKERAAKARAALAEGGGLKRAASSATV
jgi:ATP-dependent DNA helicase PIF1